MRQWERSRRGEEGGMEVWQQAEGSRQSQVNERGWGIGSAPGLLTCMKAPRIFRASW